MFFYVFFIGQLQTKLRMTRNATASLTSSFRCRRWRARRAGTHSRRDPSCELSWTDWTEAGRTRPAGVDYCTVTAAADTHTRTPDEYQPTVQRRRHLNRARRPATTAPPLPWRRQTELISTVSPAWRSLPSRPTEAIETHAPNPRDGRGQTERW